MKAGFFSTLCFLAAQKLTVRGGSPTIDKGAAREQAVEMFLHGYNSYMTYAYPADELMPLSCAGRVRGLQPSRGDIDDTLGKFSLTLIDSLDTLAVLGLLDDFEDAVYRVIQDVTFDTDIVVSVFETNIRVLGGLLGGHIAAIDLRKKHDRLSWYKDELLHMAKDLGYRLLPAFNTSTGVPYPRVNLRHGIGKERREKDTCTACAGSMLLEFSALSRLTGDPIFEDKAKHVMHTLWAKRQRTSNLVGTVINIHTGDWVRKDSGVGAGIDSYYEYLLKGYVLLGDEGYYERFSTHYDAIMTYINKGAHFIDVHMHRPQSKSRNFMDALFAFWPGLQVLFGDIAPAIKTHQMLYQVTQRHNFLPEAFTPEYDVHWGQHPLRPEFVESTYFLYKATNDPHYLEVGIDIMDSLQKYARVPCGFAGIKDVRTGSHEDRMDSFVLAETFKYLYLLFSEPEDLVLPIDDYLFTTEAHILPLTLANHKNNTEEIPRPSTQSTSRSCPSHDFHFPTGKSYADAVRDSLPKLEPASCPMSQGSVGSPSTTPRLKASEFVPGNRNHMKELGRMGIQLVTLDDGRVQLMHSASKARTTADAEEGMKFMQEIIEITKQQQSENVDYRPRVVQVISPDSLRSVVLAAGPAQFGLDIEQKADKQIVGNLIKAQPFDGCTEPENSQEISGNIAIAIRGNCMFIAKARNLEKHGATGVIIMDNNESTSSDTAATFAMSGDGTDDVNIGVVFLFHKEGMILVDAIENNGRVDVVVTDKAKPYDEILNSYISMKMEEHLGFPAVEVNVDPHIYTQEGEGTIKKTGTRRIPLKVHGVQSSQKIVVKIDIDADPAEQSPTGDQPAGSGEYVVGNPAADGPKTDLGSGLGSAGQGTGVLEDRDKVLLRNIQDLLQNTGQEAGSDSSPLDAHQMSQRLQQAMHDYMEGQEGGLGYEAGSVIAPEDMEAVVNQVRAEFAKLENIREVMQALDGDESSGSVGAIDSLDSGVDTGSTVSSRDGGELGVGTSGEADRKGSQEQQGRQKSIRPPVEENNINKDEL